MKSILNKIKPKYFYDDEGKKIGVFLSPKDFEKLTETLEELSDYYLVIEREKEVGKTYTFEEVRAETLARMKKHDIKS